MGLLAGLAGAAQAQQSATRAAERRTLPIRYEELSRRLSRPQPLIRFPSIAPNGSKIVYLEETASVAADGAPRLAVMLLDAARGRQRVLSLVPWDYRMYQSPGFRWSADSRYIAALEYGDSTLNLLVWDTSADAAPVRTSLTRLRGGALDDVTVTDWSWYSDRDQLILSALAYDQGTMRQRLQKPGLEATNRLQGYAWYLSRFDTARASAARAAMIEPRFPLRLFALDLATQKWKTIPPRRDLDVSALPIAKPAWLPDRRQLLLSTADSVIYTGDGWMAGYQQWLATTGDSRADAYRAGHTRLWSLDEQTGAVLPQYVGGPGVIGSVVRPRGSQDLVFVEGDPALGVWPTGYPGFAALRWIDAKTGDRVKLAGEPVPLNSVLYPSDRPTTVFLYEPSAPEQRLSEVTLATGGRRVISPSGYSVNDCAVAAGGAVIAAVLENVNAPPEVYLWSRARPTWRKLTDYAASYEGPGARIETVTWRSRDDRFDVHGLLVKPSDYDSAKKYPLLVLIHGGPGSAVRNEYYVGAGGRHYSLTQFGAGMPQVLAAGGYLVFLPNFRGDEGFGFAFNAAARGHLDQTYTEDIDAGVDYLIAKGWVDPDKLGILGHSAGGVQLAYAITHTNRYKAAVNSDGPAFLPDVSTPEEESEVLFPGGSLFDHLEGFRVALGEDPMQGTWADPRRIRTPLLVRWNSIAADSTRAGLYGLRWDDTWGPVVLHTTKKLSVALKTNGVPFEAIVDRDLHAIQNPTYLVEWQSRLLQWFDYFVLGKGDNPIPAMQSPLDYSALNPR